jgi:hypothetical protein
LLTERASGHRGGTCERKINLAFPDRAHRTFPPNPPKAIRTGRSATRFRSERVRHRAPRFR